MIFSLLKSTLVWLIIYIMLNSHTDNATSTKENEEFTIIKREFKTLQGVN